VSIATALPATGSRLADMAPSITAALSFSVTDILLKVVYADGMDVLTLVSLRGLLVVVFFFFWLRVSPPGRWHSRRERRIALGLGVLFAGSMFGLLMAVSLLPVSIAILAYFVYPVLTGLGGAVTGVDRLGWRAMLTAMVAFGGLALILGVQFSTLAPLGIGYALAAAVARVISLLATRAYLSGTDARVTTWYSMVPSAAMFVAAALIAGTWHPPQSIGGWLAFLGVTAGSTFSTWMIYISTNRVGPFRTALAMNLEPLVTALASVALLGEVFTPVQAVGAGIMIAALCVFQFVRGR
jgi:probable blue pigment (indigoidine) exporter